MRASAILVESMVNGSRCPRGARCRRSVSNFGVIRTSCLPSITRLRWQTCVDAGDVGGQFFLARSVRRLPSLDADRIGSEDAPSIIWFVIGNLDLPKKLSIPESSPFLRLLPGLVFERGLVGEFHLDGQDVADLMERAGP